MSFLKALGGVLKEAAAIGVKIASFEPLVSEFSPLVGALLPTGAAKTEQTVVSDFDSISQAVTTAETNVTAAIGAAVTGPQKLAAATQSVGTILNSWLDSHGLKVADTDAQKVEGIAQSIASAWADLLNVAQKK